ncbi:MarR family winged helix-turn-helix transcriptional regulator [Rhodococcus tibetensis]|uniref:MarR family transcriptional regulator n=1 Tax=Rhodococcus tibetensis TaxID=2965064 RepID=A0ABT1QMK0_9NOCA|nr:MarR family transcriptional regulator [Rhodococcus sp. FXJ9.536]MCQ4122335.1 MarR family transcriptional regulator [Rhodococcus sp. FXJ9.536]
MTEEDVLDPDREHAWRAALKGHALLVARLDADLREQTDMSLIDYDVLVQLSEAPERRLSMADLARAVVYSRSGLTRLVDSLERRGLVTRERSSSDRRSWYAVLTDDGVAALEDAWPVHAAGVREHFAAHTSPEQARTLAAVFGSVIAALAPDSNELRHYHPHGQSTS